MPDSTFSWQIQLLNLSEQHRFSMRASDVTKSMLFRGNLLVFHMYFSSNTFNPWGSAFNIKIIAVQSGRSICLGGQIPHPWGSNLVSNPLLGHLCPYRRGWGIILISALRGQRHQALLPLTFSMEKRSEIGLIIFSVA